MKRTMIFALILSCCFVTSAEANTFSDLQGMDGLSGGSLSDLQGLDSLSLDGPLTLEGLPDELAPYLDLEVLEDLPELNPISGIKVLEELYGREHPEECRFMFTEIHTVENEEDATCGTVTLAQAICFVMSKSNEVSLNKSTQPHFDSSVGLSHEDNRRLTGAEEDGQDLLQMQSLISNMQQSADRKISTHPRWIRREYQSQRTYVCQP